MRAIARVLRDPRSSDLLGAAAILATPLVLALPF